MAGPDYSLLQPVKINDPFAVAMQFEQMRASQENRRGLAEQRETMAASRRALTAETEQKGIDRAARDVAYAGGITPEAVATLPGHLQAADRETLAKLDKLAFDASEARTKAKRGESEYHGSVAAGVLSYLPLGPEAVMGAAGKVVEMLKRHGDDSSQLEEAIKGGPGVTTQYLQSLVAGSKEQRELGGAEAGRTETARHNKASEGLTASGQALTAAGQEPNAGSFESHLDAIAVAKGLKTGRQLDPRTVLQEKAKWEAAGRAPQQDTSPLVAVMGPDKKPVLVSRAQALGRTPAASARPLTQTAEAGMIAKLAKQWTDASANTVQINRQLAIMKSGLDRFKADPNGASQGVLVTFQKILDPESVVRESEYARSSEGISVLQRIKGYTERLASGGAGVPESQLREMVKTAEAFVANTKDATAGVRGRIGATADRYDIPHELIFNDRSAAAPAAGGAKSDPLGIR